MERGVDLRGVEVCVWGRGFLKSTACFKSGYSPSPFGQDHDFTKRSFFLARIVWKVVVGTY